MILDSITVEEFLRYFSQLSQRLNTTKSSNVAKYEGTKRQRINILTRLNSLSETYPVVNAKLITALRVFEVNVSELENGL